MMGSRFATSLLVFLAAACSVLGYSSGPPTSVCSSLRPSHPGNPSFGNGGYIITTNIPINSANTGYDYVAGQSYTVTLTGNVNTFRGFAVQSLSVPGGAAVGNFVPQNNQQILNCGSLDYTIVHNNPSIMNFNSMSFTWNAPSTSGTVNFWYTVVRSRFSPGQFYYVRLNGIEEYINSLPPATTTAPMETTAAPTDAMETTAAPTDAMETTAAPTDAMGTTAAPTDSMGTTDSGMDTTATVAIPTAPSVPVPASVATPTRDPLEYDVIFRDPPSCIPSECTTFVGMEPNEGDGSYVDIYMEGQSEGWVAIGFTETPDMFSADVIACNYNPGTGMIEVLDTWNPNSRANQLDDNQNAFLHSGQLANGRISCTIGRPIAGTQMGAQEDYNLNAELYVLYGRRTRDPAPARLLTHFSTAPNPTISPLRMNYISPGGLPSRVTIPTRAPLDYDIILREPADCSPDSCTMFIAMDVNEGNGDYLDIYMQGETAGWIAVGFTQTPSMFLADVIACNLNPDTGMIEVLDTWNPNTRANQVDDTQDAILFSGDFSDGRITCTVARSIAGSGGQQDFNLDGFYHILSGRRLNMPSAGLLETHIFSAPNPSISQYRINPTNGITEPTAEAGDYPLVFKTPDSCDVSDCTVYVGIAVNEGNSDYLDFYIEGDAEAWVAVGVSNSPSMSGTDVMACNRISGGEMVEVLDAWNPGYSNQVDDVQDTFMYTSSVEDGRIICSFGRSITGAGDGQDLNLNNAYYVLFGRSNGLTSQNFLISHRTASPASNPTISEGQFNIVQASAATLPPPSTMAPNIPAGVTMPTAEADEYPLVFKTPDSCDVSDCTVYVGIAVNEGNSDYLDFYIEGDAEAWVAVGVSATPNMPSTDVMACNRISGGEMVEVLDAWNPGYSNQVDDVQDTFMYTSSVEDGRIICSFGRSITGAGDGQDLNLNNAYYVLFGRSNGLTSQNFLISHRTASPASNPTISEGQFNIVQASAATLPPPSTMAPNIPAGVTMPTTAPVDYPLVFKTPDSCDVSDCTVYVGIAVNEGNSDYLDFYIEGDAEAWVAVGVSATPNMPNTDVMACNRISGGEMVEVLDAWNTEYNNIVDDDQDTFMYTSSVEDGRIICSFGRSITGAGNTQDLNLNEKYYVLFGRSNGRTSQNFLISHRTASPASNPTVTEEQFNVVQDSGVAGGSNFENVKNGLIRAHGIFMLVAWMLLANVAIAFAAYMRPALPNGEWFQVHRAFMIIALFLAAAGFVLIFISQIRSDIPGLINIRDRTRVAHLVIGIIVMCLQIVNPLIAICRCKPDDTNRWIFNILHGFPGIGFIAEILAFTNVGIGLAIFSENFSRFGNLTIFWLFIAYIIINALLHPVMICMGSVFRKRTCSGCNNAKSECQCSSQANTVLMDAASDTVTIQDDANKSAGGEKGPKKPAKYSFWRWLMVLIWAAITASVVLALLVLVALP